ncbi:MAG: tRNA pseudouridine(55) synthase TruB [Clostridiales bacterium]|nr:tRNA pseudouridine(55) synthase TruB [Clostridiales bacterium]
MDGIIIVYKECGYTSHDVVAKLRGILGQKKIGHTGTLDPEAEGVLPVCLGNATKVCDMLTDWDKEYNATLLLGRTTDTQDTTGKILRECPVTLAEDGADGAIPLTEEEIRNCIDSFVGEQMQVPPMYSALKVDGKKLYELARQGVEVERKPRRITIKSIEIKSIKEVSLPAGMISDETECKATDDQRMISAVEVEIKVRCSKGTYIRTLCNDIGEDLGCGGCMSLLLRTQVGPFSLADAYQLSEIEELRDEKTLGQCIFPTDSVFPNMEAVLLTPEAEKLVRNGNPLSRRMLSGCEKYDYLDEEDVRFPDRKSWERVNWSILQGRSKTKAVEATPNGLQSLSATLRNHWLDADRVRLYGQNWEFLAVYRFNKEKSIWRAEKMFL